MGALNDVLLACFVQLSFLSVCVVEESLEVPFSGFARHI